MVFRIKADISSQQWNELRDASEGVGSFSLHDDEDEPAFLPGLICMRSLVGPFVHGSLSQTDLHRIRVFSSAASTVDEFHLVRRSSSSVCYRVLMLSFAAQLGYTIMLFEENANENIWSDYEAPENGFSIKFVRIDENVLIGSGNDFRRGQAIVVSKSDFMLAANTFLGSLAEEIQSRAPDFMELSPGRWLRNVLENKQPRYPLYLVDRGRPMEEQIKFIEYWKRSRRL